MPTIHGDIQSGNCYKIKMLLHRRGVACAWRHVDVVGGEAKGAAFLQINPNGKVPAAVLDDGRVLAESNAVLNYFAGSFMPDDSFLRAQVLQWQFWEQYEHEPCIAVARFIRKFQGMPEHRRAQYDSAQKGGRRALQTMERHLSQHDYFTGGAETIADISLYAYTHVADEGGFDLRDYPAVRRWLRRMENNPRHISMKDAEAEVGRG